MSGRIIFYFLLSIFVTEIHSSNVYSKKIYTGSRSSKSGYPQGDKCDDVAIIGAGIAGTYAGWRLRNQNKQITIYEYSNRVGGRLYTTHFQGVPDINLELAAMRFLPESHKLLDSTIRQLGLPVIDFKLREGAFPDTLMYIRGVHLRNEELGGNKTPFRLRPDERKSIEQLKWEIYRNHTDVLSINVPEENKKYFAKTSDGIPMYMQSVQSVYHKAVSIEVQNYFTVANSFRFTQTDASASMGIVTSPPSESVYSVKTVATGMSSIPNALLAEFLQSSNRHNLQLNYNLKSIKRRQDGMYVLGFEKTMTTDRRTKTIENGRITKRCAKQVILAVNRLALERLDWDGLFQQKIREYLTEAVKDIPAAKMYFLYNKPWWRQSPVYANYSISDTPLRQTYDFGTSRANPSKSVLQAMYADDEISLWLELVKRENGNFSDGDIAFSVSKEAIRLAHRYLSEIYKLPQSFIPSPDLSIIGLWSTYPYGGGWQKWMPGYIWPSVEKAMVKPSRTDDVFIVCNAFNSRSMSYWSNGALEAVELAMPYFGLRSTK